MKKNYINPEVSVLQFVGTSLMQAGSGASSGSTPTVHGGDLTDDQW